MIEDVIGVIPAGGQASRLAPLPMSKELYPIGFRYLPDGQIRPKVVAHYLLENLRLAGISKTYIVLRPGKWDIPAYFGDGTEVGMQLGYLIVRSPYGVPYTLDQAYEFVKGAIVAVGFPDILFQPADMFVQLLARRAKTGADVVLGVVPFAVPEKAGMVDFDANGRIRALVEKPRQSQLRYSWCTAVWTPTFTEFMHQYLAGIEATHVDAIGEIPLGDVIQAAIDHKLCVEAEVFDRGSFLDIGTPADLVRAVHQFAQAIQK